MRRSSVRLLLACVTLLGSGCAMAPGGPDATEPSTPRIRPPDGAPLLSVGDHWVERIYYEDAPNASIGGRQRYLTSIERLDRPPGTEAYRLDEEGNGTMWWRTSDWALVRASDQEGPSRVEHSFEPPCVVYEWPLEVGSEWEAACQRTTNAGGLSVASQRTLRGRVEARESVEVPSGNFSAFRVNLTITEGETTATHTEYFAAEACAPVRTVTMQAGRRVVYDLVAYECGLGPGGAVTGPR